MGSTYFETVTNAGAYSARRPLNIKNLNVLKNIKPGSKWAANELFSARVVIRTARPDREFGHLLPILRRHSDLVLAARAQPRIQALLEVPSRLDEHRTMTETELVHLYGTSLGSFWAALAQFGDGEGIARWEDSSEGKAMGTGLSERDKRPYSSSSDQSASALPVRSKRIRTAPNRQDFVDVTKVQIESSSPQRSSQQTASQGSDPGFVSKSHVWADVPEQATLQIASTFIRHILRASPPQDDTLNHKPPYLVEFSGVSREFSGKTAVGEWVNATADGELVLYRLDNNKRYRLTGQRPALLEAKRRFAVVRDGQPCLTDELLGQMTCEALALCLEQAQAGAENTNDRPEEQ
ncbi:hypothetical protein F5144DRAFT_480707 [Chaetomium tenue]|uniref:Uncharacterized protein n=1 Tax=Chaetomium tenue TaxID=1854479 RepID=A0ACB7PMJ2_9PEZI|nr:hypothetical protein F5144DRAFT_480707 [Chaetomium globosum]